MCNIVGCGRASIAKDLCAKHYMRLRRTGDANRVRKPGPKKRAESVKRSSFHDWSPSTQARFDQALRMLVSAGGKEEVERAIKMATRPDGSVNVSKLLGMAASVLGSCPKVIPVELKKSPSRYLRVTLSGGGTSMWRLWGPSNELEVSRGRGVGCHCIADLWGASHLTDARVLTAVLETASSAAGATLLKIFLHEFPSSGGITGVALLAESHMSIHTWPEKGYAAIDIFMCGRADTRRALDVLIVQLKPTHTLVQHFIRGRSIRPREQKGQRLTKRHRAKESSKGLALRRVLSGP
jgi:S-adenosylmethionine decarboxylase